MSNENKKCQKISGDYIMPGWGCCKCRTYNGEQRSHCKVCQHPRCDNSEKKLDNKLN